MESHYKNARNVFAAHSYTVMVSKRYRAVIKFMLSWLRVSLTTALAMHSYMDGNNTWIAKLSVHAIS